ncbi:MAG TPA: ABC transporter permease [Pirellulales bacterium]|jgi:ribose/xylose/arabinose/galactoside ABC-type transport system permease subunit|nr:ABC transporter permease [Pirellulales bacterium]
MSQPTPKLNDSRVRIAAASRRRWYHGLLALVRALAAVACVIALFALVDVALHGKDATFWTKQNLQTISVQNAFVAICSLGMLLIMIAGGIDLSAGVALALCATVVAWGMREDVGFLIAHGENVAWAARNLKTADDALKTAQRKNDAAQVAAAQAQLDHRRSQVAELLQIKVDQLQQQLSGADESQRAELDKQLAEAKAALASINDANAPVEADPAWLNVLPNAAGSSWLALLMGLGCGMLCGLLNGILVVVLRVVPFIATLGTMTIYLGLAKLVADETAVRPSTAQVPQWLGELSAVRPDPAWLQVSKGVWLALILAAIMACILRYTVFGRYVFALGSNESTARLCGINVPLVKIAVYTIAGLLVGIASICFFVRLNSGNPTSGTGLELKFIAAVVIGGGSLNGGRGSVLGTLAGTAIMGVIASGCTLLDLRNPVQDIILGVIIVAAVTIDQLRHRSA